LLAIEAQGANDAWLQVLERFRRGDAKVQSGRREPTRELLRVILEVRDPRQRWVVSRNPPINVPFALAEILWILNGQNESAFLNFWNSKMPLFAGSGSVYPGAYGHRLRAHFGIDQLERAAEVLSANSTSRQVVLQIWDPATDLPVSTGEPRNQDIPCNVSSLLKVRDGKLEWLQVIRSNDLFLGLPYNFVQFTTLQEILAGWIGANLGSYVQLSDSLHVYEGDSHIVMTAREEIVPENRDSLALTRNESDWVLGQIYEIASQMIPPSIRDRDLHQLVMSFEGPAPYRNWVALLGAEAARRRRWLDLADELAKSCSNALLSLLWSRWLSRFAVKSSGGVPATDSQTEEVWRAVK
jgi:thymidylate synthase